MVFIGTIIAIPFSLISLYKVYQLYKRNIKNNNEVEREFKTIMSMMEWIEIKEDDYFFYEEEKDNINL